VIPFAPRTIARDDAVEEYENRLDELAWRAEQRRQFAPPAPPAPPAPAPARPAREEGAKAQEAARRKSRKSLRLRALRAWQRRAAKGLNGECSTCGRRKVPPTRNGTCRTCAPRIAGKWRTAAHRARAAAWKAIHKPEIKARNRRYWKLAGGKWNVRERAETQRRQRLKVQELRRRLREERRAFRAG
jgi:hypothetical protein